jgi:uncharacterized protein YeaO (DUF488 family)
MLKMKHLLDTVEPDDGMRVWVEPIGLTRDLRQWCSVDHLLCHLGPPMKLWNWFARHPDGYEYFRGQYHQHLAHSQYTGALRGLACAAVRDNFTLVHQGDDPAHNTATALHEFLSELASYCPPDGPDA